MRFLLIGGSSALLNLLFLWLLSAVFGLWYLLASVLSYLLCMTYNFLLQRAWAFNGRGGAVLRQGFLFAAANVLGLAVNTAVFYLLVEKAGLWYIAAQAAASVIVAVQSFFAYRWIFARGDALRGAARASVSRAPGASTS